MEPTCEETQEVEDTAKEVHVECRFLEIVPREEWTGLFGRIEPSPESLEVTLLSQYRLGLT